MCGMGTFQPLILLKYSSSLFSNPVRVEEMTSHSYDNITAAVMLNKLLKKGLE